MLSDYAELIRPEGKYPLIVSIPSREIAKTVSREARRVRKRAAKKRKAIGAFASISAIVFELGKHDIARLNWSWRR